jgi:hypothetical protein
VADAGVGIADGQSFVLGSILSGNFQLAVIEYAAQELQASSGVVGTVYDDFNGNGLYDAGEGISGANVSLVNGVGNDSTFYRQVITNPAGGFFIDTAPGNYTVLVQRENEAVLRAYTVKVQTTRKWLGFDILTKN